MTTLILDNYDSFTFNLAHYLGALGGEPVVHRNDRITLDEIRALAPARIVLSPGPGDPRDLAYFGVCHEVIVQLGPHLPVLGVCLGHQGIAAAYGARIVRAPEVMHGKTSPVQHDGSALFLELPSPFEAMRYHSLIVEAASLPGCLRATAHTSDGVVMGLQHEHHPVFGVQFHPESIGTQSGSGMRLLQNFLQIRA